ncbi:MAG: hypothetical protein R2849_17035 [Thermomicrobiales bacterium]
MTAVQPVYVLLVEDDEDDFILARSFLDDAETLDLPSELGAHDR